MVARRRTVGRRARETASGLAGGAMTITSSTLHWKPDNHESRLLEFLATLIIDVAQTHPAVTHEDVAYWLAGAVVGTGRKVRR